MRLRSWMALIGAAVGIGAVAALYFTLGIGWISLLIVIGVGIVSYIVAAAGSLSLTSTNVFGEIMRGWLVGMNSGLNGFIAFALINHLAGLAPGIIFGAVLGLVNLLTVFRPISQSEVYQGILGWMNWLLPMSWVIVGVGVLFYLVSFLLHGVTAGKVPYLRIVRLGADWKTGTFFIKGGLVANLNYLDTAFNMGNFSFVDYKSGAWHKDHEAGHTLNLAAFGWVFHLIGALDENATPRRANAYSERLAESNSSGTSGTNIPMWA